MVPSVFPKQLALVTTGVATTAILLPGTVGMSTSTKLSQPLAKSTALKMYVCPGFKLLKVATTSVAESTTRESSGVPGP